MTAANIAAVSVLRRLKPTGRLDGTAWALFAVGFALELLRFAGLLACSKLIPAVILWLAFLLWLCATARRAARRQPR